MTDKNQPVEASAFGTLDMIVESPTGRKSYTLGMGRLYFDTPAPPPPPEPGASGRFSASFTADFSQIELYHLAFNAALAASIKQTDVEEKRWAKIRRLLDSSDRRQWKRGYRLWETGK